MSSSQANSRIIFVSGDRVAVLLPLPLGGAYDYLVPDGVTLNPGDVVEVPLGRRVMDGVVWGAGSGDFDISKLKEIRARLDCPAVPEVSRRFADWVADYTLTRPGAVAKMILSVPAALEPPKPAIAFGLGETEDDLRLTPARKRVLDFMGDKPPLPIKHIALGAAVGESVIKGLAESGALIKISTRPPSPFKAPDPEHPGPILSEDQKAASQDLMDKVGQGYCATLLEGVTGSGKTEVYFEAVAEALRQDKQVLVLVPEIALTAQWLGRFEARFGTAPAQWHSDLPQGLRRKTWRAIAEGQAQVVIGARSALFLPYPDLGLIVVDEEHEAAFKQEEGVIYHGRDMAVVRANLGEIPVVLASATPSLETVLNAKAGRYQHAVLPERHGGAVMPEIHLLDLRNNEPVKGDWGQSWISPPLVKAVEETMAAGQQSLLFLNRRGYAPLTLCRHCGFRLQCPNCTAWLVEHRRVGRLQCHHCGYSARIPKVCPECEEEDTLAACGPGVERLSEEVQGRWPKARVAVAASDTVTGPQAAAELVRKVIEREVDILIGTQMLAKGHHFPGLTLAGVVDADIGLSGGDLRAAERTFQLLSQVAGRTGRGADKGRVLIQTTQPAHPVMAAIAGGSVEAFMAAEEEQRRATSMPPYGRLAGLIVSGPDVREVEDVARNLGRCAPHGEGLQVLGPVPAPLSLLRGKFRHRLLLKVRRDIRIQAVLRDWLGRVKVPGKVRVQVDVDPYSFL